MSIIHMRKHIKSWFTHKSVLTIDLCKLLRRYLIVKKTMVLLDKVKAKIFQSRLKFETSW